MSFLDPQNPGIGGENQLTSAEVAVIAALTALGTPAGNVILGYDTTDANYAYFVLGSGLTYTHSTHTLSVSGSTAVTSITIASSNGFAGSSSGGSTPALTISTSITGILQGNGTAISAATTTGSGNLVLATSPTLSSPVVGTQTATDNSTLAASTAFVQNAIANAVAGVNPATSVNAATTAAGDTSGFTYSNGASGIGATFTGAINTAVVIDSFTFNTLGQRLLVKNDTQTPSGAFNGVYTLTALQTVGTGAIFTRALDYDTPSDMNSTGAIPVISGNTNTLTSWLITTTVVTVGTTPISYTQFSFNPSRVIPANLGGTGVANNAASTLTISGNFGTTFTVTATTSVTLPTSGTLVNTAVTALSSLVTHGTVTSGGLGTGATLGGVTMSLGSDAVGDMYAATTSNVLSRIPAVAVGQVLISKGVTTLPAWSASPTVSNLITTANAITASSNAATIPVTSRHNIVTNNSAATLTITLTTSGAVNMQMVIVQILDFSAVAETITWVNTENSTVTAPTTSNGSTTLPLTVGFIYNSGTSKWRCIASA